MTIQSHQVQPQTNAPQLPLQTVAGRYEIISELKTNPTVCPRIKEAYQAAKKQAGR
ncbi:MAG: hypothetical protein NTZ52_02670 [Chlamydiae bacterium]|nr:hypothetical protein [Chlamydiota bacterium]